MCVNRILEVVDPSSSRGVGRLGSGDHVSLACIYLALQTYGLTVPYVGEGDGRRGGGSAAAWFNAFSRDLSKEKLVGLATALMEVYNSDEAYIGPHESVQAYSRQ